MICAEILFELSTATASGDHLTLLLHELVNGDPVTTKSTPTVLHTQLLRYW